jgi:hypothetical protein
MASPDFEIVKEQITISYYLGSVRIEEQIKERNKYNFNYTMDPVD